MIYLKRFVRGVVLVLFLNCAYLLSIARFNIFAKILAVALLFAAYLYIIIKPRGGASGPRKLKALIGGYELTLMASFCIVFETALYAAYFNCPTARILY